MTGRRTRRTAVGALVLGAFVAGALAAALTPRAAHRRALDQLRPDTADAPPLDPADRRA